MSAQEYLKSQQRNCCCHDCDGVSGGSWRAACAERETPAHFRFAQHRLVPGHNEQVFQEYARKMAGRSS